jgi:hypothetical protein
VWIGVLLRGYGTNLFRDKGVIYVKGMEECFVFQGVHMLFQGTFTTPWVDGEERCSKFVFIGRNLLKERMVDEFNKCETLPLRFEVGPSVRANVGKFKKGTVVKQWDEGNAYRIRLSDGTNVFAPVDHDDYVRVA